MLSLSLRANRKIPLPRRVNPAINLSFRRARTAETATYNQRNTARGRADPRITIRHLPRAESVSEQALLRVRFTCRIPKSCRGWFIAQYPTPPLVILLLLLLFLFAIPLPTPGLSL